jgi:hypothetical protein
MTDRAVQDTAVDHAANKANVIGFNSALDALLIKVHDGRNCLAWHSGDESRMVTQNTSHRGRGTWGESNVFTADRAAEFVEKADNVEVVDKRPFNYIRPQFERKNGLGAGTAWSVALYFGNAHSICSARERTLESVPGIGERKARRIRGAVGHLEPPEKWKDG